MITPLRFRKVCSFTNRKTVFRDKSETVRIMPFRTENVFDRQDL